MSEAESTASARRVIAVAVLGVLLTIINRVCVWYALNYWIARNVALFSGVRFTFLLNKGIVFSIPLPLPLFTILAAVIVIFLVWMAVRAYHGRQWMVLVALVWVVAGAASNIIDRILYGGVVDYLQFFLPSVINLADVMILCGVAGVFWFSRTPQQRES